MILILQRKSHALISLDPSNSAGYDQISPKLLKHCAPALCSVLHHLFRLCLDQSYIPSDWHMHLITPILKSGDKSQVTNYRPISLLCITSKILERLVYNHLVAFIGNSFSPAQFGFRKRHSTLQQLLTFLFKVYNSINAHSQTDVIYLDFKKAFDRVAHNELLDLLVKYGIGFKHMISQTSVCYSQQLSIRVFTSHFRCSSGKYTGTTSISDFC